MKDKPDKTQPEETKKAVIYARFSSYNQTEQSIEGQLRVCYEYAESQNIIVIDEYIDRALTGRSDDRPAFQKMITDSKNKQFDYVLVYKLDRFARNRYDSAMYRHKLKQNDVKILSAMEQIADNPEGIILEAMLEVMAEYYSLELSQKINRGMTDAALKGQFVGGNIPWGYKVENKFLVIDEIKAPYIKEAFELYAQGEPKKNILKMINDAGFRNAVGKEFSNTGFNYILKNELYTGVTSWNNVITLDRPELAIIDKETFQKVQKRMGRNRRMGAKNTAKVRYLLSGKIYCGECGSTIIGSSGTGRSGERFYYYLCRAKRRKLNDCKKRNEKKDELEDYIVQQTLDYVLAPERIEFIAERIVEEYNKDLGDSRVQQLENHIKKLEKDIVKYTKDALEMPSASRKIIYDMIENADVQKRELSLDLARLKISKRKEYNTKEIVAWLKEFCEGDLMSDKFKERIIDAFVNSIYVYDDKIAVFYNVRGAEQVTYPEAQELLAKQKKTSTKEGVRLSNSVVDEYGIEP